MRVCASLPFPGRDLRLDLFRGLANWAIFLDHIPHEVMSSITTRNYGFSDAADLFVFIAGYTAASVFGRIMIERGWVSAATKLAKRAARLYAAHIVVLGYPHLFTSEGKTCNLNFLTSSNEKKLNETGDKLDAVVKARAAAHGFTFVDPRSAFKAHEVCASEEWLNGQSNPLEESYHPNVKGQARFTTEVSAVLP